MNEKRKLNPLTIVFSLMIAALLAFIWGNSMKSIPESQEQSLSLLARLQPFLDKVFGAGVITDHILRKTAHFCEFGLLGVLLSLNKLTLRKHHFKIILLCLAEALFVASADETIQIFFHRGSQLRDVLLDFSGATVGIGGIFFLAWLFRRFRDSSRAVSRN